VNKEAPYVKNKFDLVGDGGIWDTWEAKPQANKYLFEYTPSTPETTHTIVVESEKKIHYVSPKGEYENGWLIIGDSWVDFEPYMVEYNKITPYKYEVIVNNPELHDTLVFESAGDLNIVTRNYTYFNLNASLQYEKKVLDEFATNYYLNLTEYTSTPNVTLELNNTNITPSLLSVSGGVRQYRVHNTPNTGTNTFVNLSHRWYVSYPNKSIITNAQNQSSYKARVTNCTTGVHSMNWTVLDEITLNNINASMSGIYIITPVGYTTSKTFTITHAESGALSTCIYPAWATYSTTADITYQSTGYAARNYNLLVTNLSNQTQNRTLYLLNTSVGSTVTITVQDNNLQKLQNYVVEAYKYDPINAIFDLVDTDTTNNLGETQLFMVVGGGDDYQFKVYDPQGTLVETTTPGAVTSTSFTITVTLTAPVTINPLLQMVYGITSTLEYDNATQDIILSYDDTNNNTLSNCLIIKNNNQTVISTQCSNLTTNTLTYTTSINQAYIAQYVSTYKNDNKQYLIKTISVDRTSTTSIKEEAGLDATLLAFIMLGVVMLAGIVVHPVLGFVLGAMMLTGLEVLGFLNIGWVATASTVALLLLFAIMSGRRV
jgi:hypothetical protein